MHTYLYFIIITTDYVPFGTLYLLEDFATGEGELLPAPVKVSKDEDEPFLFSLGLLPGFPNSFLVYFSHSLASHSSRALSSSTRRWSIRSASKNVCLVNCIIKYYGIKTTV